MTDSELCPNCTKTDIGCQCGYGACGDCGEEWDLDDTDECPACGGLDHLHWTETA